MIVKNLGISKGTGLSDAGESRLLYSHEKKPKIRKFLFTRS